MRQGQREQVERARTVIINHILEEIKGVVQVSLERDVEEYYHDWNFPNNSGIIMFLLEEEVNEESPDCQYNIINLESEIARISKLVEKVPDQIHVFPLSSLICLVDRKGILIPIEKHFIKKGLKRN